MKWLKFTLLPFLLLFLVIKSNAQDGWTNLIQDKKLKNWETKGGTATYKYVNGVIEGYSKIEKHNTFLCTKKAYGDFILEFETKIAFGQNSGVQFRSTVIDREGRKVVQGYQCELETTPRAFSGGVYEEQDRGWLYPVSRNPKGRKAFINGTWNKVRIQAIGQEISIFVNGIQTSRLIDNQRANGIIGLQMHATNVNGAVNRWRNIRIKISHLETERWSNDPQVPEISFLKNELTAYEKDHGWRLLWDGKTTKGWRGAKRDDFPPKGWEINDGVLTVLKTDGGESTGPGDIITTKRYSDFILEVDFKITKGANSGIKYFVDPTLNKGAGSAIGCEYQILDDKNHPDAKQGVNGNRTVASLYDLITAENLNTKGRAKPYKKSTWNRARIVSNNGIVEHWLNGEKVIEYDRHSQIFRALVAYSKYKNWKNFGEYPEGYILLQDHGDTVHFMNVKIKEL